MSAVPFLRVSLSNVQGEGATQLVKSLLPALEDQEFAAIGRIDLPARGPSSNYARRSPGPEPVRVTRRLPNAISRFAECLMPVPGDDAAIPILTLGDIPLRSSARQTVFIHNTHVISRQLGVPPLQQAKFSVMRAVFRRNIKYITAAVVQTDLMRRQLVGTYPSLTGRVHVICQPPPSWLLDNRTPLPRRRPAERLRLFYPAADYPHKNHKLIEQLAALPDAKRAVASIVLTLDLEKLAASPLLEPIGRLRPEAMCVRYAETDALFFPSLSESYGLPLVEAMWLGLPIIAADLPYARELCGNIASYFDPHDPAAALAAVNQVRDHLLAGWRPDWREQLRRIPSDWGIVAESLVNISIGNSS